MRIQTQALAANPSPVPASARILEVGADGNVIFEMAVLTDEEVLLYRSEKVDLDRSANRASGPCTRAPPN